ncbi:hypothetical protein LEP1GSC049_3080 [Leptospira kirschneri serovar Cynopteri str. 3522 CT]|nr:hypothetical protein LEP1GSC049_3080 [Leptospira kirschneri serovar Cynopteri str. 3522 CT]
MKEISACEEALEILKQGKDEEHVEDILAKWDYHSTKRCNFTVTKKRISKNTFDRIHKKNLKTIF